MIVKILCSCGTKYSFEVEPVNGRLPAPVNCPNCNAGGTEAANEYVRQMLATGPAPISTPPSPTATGPGAAPPAAPRPTREEARLRRAEHPDGHARRGRRGLAGDAGLVPDHRLDPNRVRNHRVGRGRPGGLGCRLLGGGYSQKLGIIAGACAFVAIVGGEYLATRSAYNRFLDAMMDEAWEQHLAYAKEADQLTTDDEIKAFLAKHGSEEWEPAIAPETITADQVREFRQADLPELKKTARGGNSKAGFERKVREHLDAAEMQSLILKDSFSLWTLLWLFLGVGTAYRLGVGATE